MKEDFSKKAPHIGIVAGTADGAALCFRTLCHEAERLMGPHAHPEITMHSQPLDAYLALIDAGDWAGVAALMSRSASVVAQAGAELIICPNNTLHRAFHLVSTPVPWLHIASAVQAEASRLKFRRVGLLGTQAVMQGAVYQPILEPRGIEILLPQPREQVHLDRIVRDELIRGIYPLRARSFVLDVISTMAAQGAEAVILGCTELPLLLQEEDAVLPLLDSTRILALAALQRVVPSAWANDMTPAVLLTSH